MDPIASAGARFLAKKHQGVGMRALGAMCGVSRTTVSLALQDSARVTPDVKARIQKIARDVGYVRNPYISNAMSIIASSRQRATGRAVAVIVNARCATERVHSILRNEIKEVCDENAVGVTFFELTKNASIRVLRRIIDARRVTGCLFVGFSTPEPLLADFASLPAVAIGTPSAIPHVTTVLHDRADAARSALQKLLIHGYRQPAILAFSGRDCLEPPMDLTEAITPDSSFRQSSKKIAEWLRARKPDVVLGFGHMTGQLLIEFGCDLPYVDLECTSAFSCYAAVDPDFGAIGRTAMELLINFTYESRQSTTRSRRTILVPGSWRSS